MNYFDSNFSSSDENDRQIEKTEIYIKIIQINIMSLLFSYQPLFSEYFIHEDYIFHDESKSPDFSVSIQVADYSKGDLLSFMDDSINKSSNIQIVLYNFIKQWTIQYNPLTFFLDHKIRQIFLLIF